MEFAERFGSVDGENQVMCFSISDQRIITGIYLCCTSAYVDVDGPSVEVDGRGGSEKDLVQQEVKVLYYLIYVKYKIWTFDLVTVYTTSIFGKLRFQLSVKS
jgi:hypothetical protein